MSIPDDLDALLALLKSKHEAVLLAVERVETELAAGRTGHADYVRARILAEEYQALHEVAQARYLKALEEI